MNSAISCSKCGGLCVLDNFHDPGSNIGENKFVGWRCLTCGKITDSVIQGHQVKTVEKE